MKTPAKTKAVNQTKSAKTGKGKSVSSSSPKYERLEGDDPIPTAEESFPETDTLTKTVDALKDPAPAEPFAGKGDHDNDGKAGGTSTADKSAQPRPMPRGFKVDTAREGSRIVARQDGIEVAFRHTDDKDEYAARELTMREDMWAALEARRIRAL